MQTFKKEKVNFQDFDLKKSIQTALDELEYDQPTPIQIETYSTVRSGKDLVGVAQTGTGKTLAYLLPIVDWLSYSEQRMPRVIVMVPTRELVMQVVKEVEKITPYLSVRTVAVYGATNINTQKQKVYDGCDILVGTPGRVYDLIMSGILRTKDVKKFVIDEVDEMFNLGFRPQTVSIMETLPPKRQNLMFSATLSEDVENLVNKFFNKPEIVKIVPHGTPLEKIIQIGYPVLNFNTKLNLLVHLLKNEEEFQKVLVFVSTKKQADAVFTFIEGKFSGQVAVIHSNKSQNQRFNAVNALHDGKVRILIATDVVARGIDILDITHVINVDTPLSPGDYIHRIGRTGRADKPGTAITFITESEGLYLDLIEEFMKKFIDLQDFPSEVEVSRVTTPDERVTPLYDIPYLKEPEIRVKKTKPSKASLRNAKPNLTPKQRADKKRKQKK